MSKKVLIGKVISTKMQKTVVVAVDMHKKHPVYGKIIRRTRRFKSRDELGAKDGATVRIEECPPFGKEVCFKVVEILEGGK
jgi:small subunit ribosomal protein S17